MPLNSEDQAADDAARCDEIQNQIIAAHTNVPPTAFERHYGEGTEYNLKPDVVVDTRGEMLVNDPADSTHRHVIVQWEGGEIWLDMSVQSDHFCIDVRQFNPDDEMKGQGVFTIVNGARQSLGVAAIEDAGVRKGNWTQYSEKPLPDKSGTPVTGHGWSGGYVITLMTDLHGKEAAAVLPSRGNG